MHVSTPAASSSSTTLIQLGGDSAFDAMIADAAARAFGSASVTKISNLGAAPAEVTGASTTSLLLVAQPDEAVWREAGVKVGSDLLPRWGVVVFGAAPAGGKSPEVEFVGTEDWNPRLVARVLRLAADRQRLRREVARLKGDFGTYGQRIAHDLRTPLGGVLTSTEMLREVLADDSPQNVALTAPILDSAEGLVKLIERVSFLAKAIASREPAELLDMGAVFWNAFQKMESPVLKAGASLTQAQTWPKILGHGSALEVVWRNLIANALEHGEKPVRMNAGWDAVEGGHRFWLTSTGRVPPEKRDSLFFPFHRLQEPGAPRGLGLPIVRRLVELDGGTFGFEETPTGEARFFFVLAAVRDAKA